MRQTLQTWDARWCTWFIATVTSFTVLEYASLKTGDPRAPFSFQLRRAFGLKPRSRARGAVLGSAVGAGAFWLARHLLDIPAD